MSENAAGRAVIQSIRVGELRPNDYNPNILTPEEMEELVSEVKHLGRLPKPVIVRPADDGYLIVDGEHGWRAAQEAGLSEVLCEVVEIDDFEARRQCYKRNRHGSPDPVRLGRMFRQMLEKRGSSQRALAREIDVSEATLRNWLLYADAADMRNDYAFERLTVHQVRNYLSLPEGERDRWLDAGCPGGDKSPDNPRLAAREQSLEPSVPIARDVGEALARIRDERLYRTGYPSFEAYCRGRWRLGAAELQQLAELGLLPA